ncbi:MAG: hypothetical protein CV089_02245 [Nitrospira sp. WS110]|nr:hypothetical protein [Nitrospira sp. WS110]
MMDKDLYIELLERDNAGGRARETALESVIFELKMDRDNWINQAAYEQRRAEFYSLRYDAIADAKRRDEATIRRLRAQRKASYLRLVA